jgi:Asp-tRNA(Asn)/Glu-tRNA(Gln) amidotransferase A subunit family amidase
MSKHLLIVRAIAALALLPMVAVEIRANVDVVELTAEQIQSEYVAGTLSAVELTQAYLDRIATFDPTYNAFIAVYKDDALAQAAAIDAELASTGARGGLFGVPVVLKDNMDVAGKRTTAGYFGFSADAGGVDLIPSNDSTLVERLRDAGAIIIGKTNMPDFAQAGNTISSIEGQTLNAYGLDQGKMFTPGGSSGGTATAVSLSMAALGFGTETFGSIQNPSAAQGLVGFRPTFGYVPIDGILPLKASRRDVAGPMAKTVYDAAAALDTIAGPTVADPRTTDAIGNAPSQPITSFLKTDALNGKRIGVFQPVWSPPLQPEVQALYQQSLTTIQDAGATLVEDVFTGTAWQDAFADNPMAGDVFRHDLEEYFSELGPTTSFETIAEFEGCIVIFWRSGGFWEGLVPLVATVETGQRGDWIDIVVTPPHARPLQPSGQLFAEAFHRAAADRPASLGVLRVIHVMGVALQVTQQRVQALLLFGVLESRSPQAVP